MSESRRRLVCSLALAVTLVAAAACGGGDDDDSASQDHAAHMQATKTPDRTVEIDMVDNAFQPNLLSVKAGETIRFVFHNKGAVQHQALIGDAHVQKEHEAEGHVHEHSHHGQVAHLLKVPPGETEEHAHTFAGAGVIFIGCHEPGHYDAGMQVVVTVA